MEVVVTTGLLELLVVQSSSRIITTNKPTSSAHPGVFQLRLWPLTAPGYLGKGLPCLSSAHWCQYPSFKSRIPFWIWWWICYMNNNTMTEMISESLRCQWVRRQVKWWPRAVQRRCRWQSSGRWLSVQGRPRPTRTRLDAVDATVTRQTEPGDGLDRQRTTSATVPRPRRRADGTWRGQWTRFSCGRRSSAARSPPWDRTSTTRRSANDLDVAGRSSGFVLCRLTVGAVMPRHGDWQLDAAGIGGVWGREGRVHGSGERRWRRYRTLVVRRVNDTSRLMCIVCK